VDVTAARPRQPLAALAIAGLALAVVAGCGLEPERRPRRISDKTIIDLVSPTSSATTPSSGDLELKGALYFVRGERLEQVLVPAGGSQITVERALMLLLSGPPRNARKGLTSSIPPGTTLRRASRSGSTLRIDLSGEIKSLGGSAAKAAYAQLVFTALDLPGVKSVRFAVGGGDIDAPTDDGSLRTIKARNYKPPLKPA